MRSWLLVLLVVAAAILAAYFLFLKEDRGERPPKEGRVEERKAGEEPGPRTETEGKWIEGKREEGPREMGPGGERKRRQGHRGTETGAPPSGEVPPEQGPPGERPPGEEKGRPRVASKMPPRERPLLEREAQERGPLQETEECSKAQEGVQDFFRYLDHERYVQALEGDVQTYARFRRIMAKLASHPPFPAGEGMNSMMMTRNIYHFYRLLDREEIRLIREIMKQEADSLELNLATFYKWLTLPERCPDPDGTRPSLDVLYQYAGFFLNTIGGRAYLFRRPLPVRLLVSYYAVRIIHEADKRGKNSYGLDVFPEIEPLAREISIYPDFHFQNDYLHTLAELQNYYLKRR